MNPMAVFREYLTGRSVFIAPSLVRAIAPSGDGASSIVVLATGGIAIVHGQPEQVYNVLDGLDRIGAGQTGAPTKGSNAAPYHAT